MNISKLLITTFIGMLLLYSCDTEKENINNPPTNGIDTLGNIYGHIQSIEGPVKDAYVTLDNSSTFSDSNGNFQFFNCTKKSSILSIDHPEFEIYSNTLIVTDSLNLNISISRLKYDYFPLKVGNHWQYYYLHYGYTPAGGFYLPALIDLEVLSKSGNYPYWTYNLKETFFDSTNNSITESYFNVMTSYNDSITFIGTNRLIGDNHSIRRYFTINYPETVSQMDPIHFFKRNIGLTGFNYGWNGNQSGWNWRCELLDYTLF